MVPSPQEGIRCRLTKSKKERKILTDRTQGGANRISNGVASRIPEDGARRLSEPRVSSFPQGRAIVFLLGGV